MSGRAAGAWTSPTEGTAATHSKQKNREHKTLKPAAKHVKQRENDYKTLKLAETFRKQINRVYKTPKPSETRLVNIFFI